MEQNAYIQTILKRTRSMSTMQANDRKPTSPHHHPKLNISHEQYLHLPSPPLPPHLYSSQLATFCLFSQFKCRTPPPTLLRPSMSENNINPPIAVVITVILLVFFFFGIFCVYFCRCFLASIMINWHLRRSPSGAIVGTNGNARTLGLHPDKIQALPAFKYCTVKDFRSEKYGLECAICLAEFRDDDLLRLLTTCCHVFHQECIDLWLESRTTCPVCRSDLDVTEETLTRSPILVRSNSVHEIAGLNRPLEDAIHININEDSGSEVKRRGESSWQAGPCSCLDKKERPIRFSRSNSTGHSITRNRAEEEDRYTLRLPDNVKINIIRGHNYAVSCITFGGFSSPSDTRNGGFGELSGCSETSNTIK